MNEVVNKENERVKRFFLSIDRMLDKVENMVTKHRPMFKGERFLTDAEVSERLKVSRRTLQDYTAPVPGI